MTQINENTGMLEYYGFRKTEAGFNVYCTLAFLSQGVAWAFCGKILRDHGKGKRYRNMTVMRMAQELWFHALAYYGGVLARNALGLLRVRWKPLEKVIGQALYIEVDEQDARAALFAFCWWLAMIAKVAALAMLCRMLAG